MQGACTESRACFNGAATFRLRKDAPEYRRPARDLTASMGPQPFGCGRCSTPFPPPPIFELQWGRNLSVAEGGKPESTETEPVASMGPQPFGCGRRRHGRRDPLCGRASMGPQPFGCGREEQAKDDDDKKPKLQWGRNLSVAEGVERAYVCDYHEAASMGPQPFGCGRGVASYSITPSVELQWGRNLSVAEGCRG